MAKTSIKFNPRAKLSEFDRALAEKFLQDLQDVRDGKKSAGEWTPGYAHGLYYNAINGKAYRGTNQLRISYELGDRESKTGGFLTFNQAKKAGGHVKKGAKGLTVCFFKPLSKIVQQANPENLPVPAGFTDFQDVKKTIPYLQFFTVFRVEDTENCKGLKTFKISHGISADEQIEMVRGIYRTLNVDWSERMIKVGEYPHFNRSFNRIVLPALDTVTRSAGAAEWCSTAIHELAHWTDRNVPDLSRKELADRYHGDIEARALEELIAEFSGAFTCARLGISYKYDRTLAYLGSWQKPLTDKPELIRKAANFASKISDWIITASGVQTVEQLETLEPEILEPYQGAMGAGLPLTGRLIEAA